MWSLSLFVLQEFASLLQKTIFLRKSGWQIFCPKLSPEWGAKGTIHLFGIDFTPYNCSNMVYFFGLALSRWITLTKCSIMQRILSYSDSCAALILQARVYFEGVAKRGLDCYGHDFFVDAGSQVLSSSALEVLSILYLRMASSGVAIWSRDSSKSFCELALTYLWSRLMLVYFGYSFHKIASSLLKRYFLAAGGHVIFADLGWWVVFGSQWQVRGLLIRLTILRGVIGLVRTGAKVVIATKLIH